MSRLTLSFREMVLKQFPLVEGEMVVGSDPSCAIHIDSLAVRERHASVTTKGGVSTLRNLGPGGGTSVNHEPVDERVLADGDIVQVGKHSLIYSRGPAEPEVRIEEFTAQARRKSAWLQILSGHNVGKNIPLHRPLTTLGTPGVQTAVIAKRSAGYFLSHLEGDTPPLVGDLSIGETSRALQEGDIIQIGNVRMQFYFQ